MNLGLYPPSAEPGATPARGLLYAGFNQDTGCFAVGTDAGFRIFNTDPLHLVARREFAPDRPAALTTTPRRVAAQPPQSPLTPPRRAPPLSPASSIPPIEESYDGGDAVSLRLGFGQDLTLEYEADDSELLIGANELGFDLAPTSAVPVMVADDDSGGAAWPDDQTQGAVDDDAAAAAAAAAAAPPPERPEMDVPGGIGIVEMLHRTNYVVLVGGGRHPKFPSSRAVVWDDLKRRVVLQFDFRSEIKAVRFRSDRIVFVLLNKVVVYTFSPRPVRICSFDTMPNDLGVVALAAFPPPPPSSSTDHPHHRRSPHAATLVFLGRARGQIQYCDLPVGRPPASATTATASAPPVSMIAAHSGAVTVAAVSPAGHLIATASVTGTLVRVFEARSGRRAAELRRGIDRADIFCLAFSLDGSRLCVASDKGTVHVFNISLAAKAAAVATVAAVTALPTRPPVRPFELLTDWAPTTAAAARGRRRRASLPSATKDADQPATSSATASGSPADYDFFTSAPHDLGASFDSAGAGAPPSFSPSASTTSSFTSSISAAASWRPSLGALASPFSSGAAGNRHSSLVFLAPLSSYFSSQWSFAHFSLQVPARCICAFADADRAGGGADAARRGIAGMRAAAAATAASATSRTLPSSSSSAAAGSPATPAAPADAAVVADNSARQQPASAAWSPPPAVAATAIVVLCADGTLHKFAFDPARGGDGVRESYHRFYRGPADDDGDLGFAAQ
ncbi:Phosphatidylinositol 3,5-bisphosphate-binding protein [Cladochytrium tenue]|nr:Phosphatidylinositol 3,5-bisphosphate-binding protein [Cladochytrium tenue]